MNPQDLADVIKAMGAMGAVGAALALFVRLYLRVSDNANEFQTHVTDGYREEVDRLRGRITVVEAELDSVHKAVRQCREREGRLVEAIEALGGTIPP